MNSFSVIICGFLILGTLPCIFGKIFDVKVSYALANEVTRYDDPSAYTPFNCSDTIEVNHQTIYMKFQSWTYFDDAASFTYSPETNLCEADSNWNFYRGRNTIYAVGDVSESVSDTHSFSFTAAHPNRADVYTCEVHLVVKTFSVISVVASILVVLTILCVLAGLWVYNRKKTQSNVNPSLVPQDQETKQSHYYENVQFYNSQNESKTVK